MNREQTEGNNAVTILVIIITNCIIFADLKAFEQRLIECVSYTRKKTKKWKGALLL